MQVSTWCTCGVLCLVGGRLAHSALSPWHSPSMYMILVYTYTHAQPHICTCECTSHAWIRKTLGLEANAYFSQSSGLITPSILGMILKEQ
jgi:hypothetical protein